MKMGVQLGGGGRVFVGCQGGCERERRIEAIVKIKNKRNRGGGRVVRGGRLDVNEEVKFLCQGGGGGEVGGVRVDVNGELKFLWKFKKRNFFYFFLWGGGEGAGVQGG